METFQNSKSEHSSAESTTSTPEFGETQVLLGDPDSAVKNRKVGPWLKQTLGFSLNRSNYEPEMLFVNPQHYCSVWAILFGP